MLTRMPRLSGPALSPAQWVQVRRAVTSPLGERLLGGRAKAIDAQARMKAVEAGSSHRAVVMYDHAQDNPYAALCDRYGSDKGSLTTGPHPYPWAPHTYADVYFRLFGHCRNSVTTLFECGIGTNNPELVSTMSAHGQPGASLRVWRDFLPNAQIVGADIDRDILFEDERITTHYVDQTDPAAIAEMFAATGIAVFDVIVDDGLHTFDGGRILFENAIDRLAPEGVYVIEDIEPEDLTRFAEYFAGSPYFVDFVRLDVPGYGVANNNMIVIRKP